MPDGWTEATWGDLAVLEYGKALSGYQGVAHGDARVFGTNGPIGWTSEALGAGPTVVVGRKGAYRGVHYAPGPFWVIDTAYWLRPVTGINLRWAYYQLLTQDINGRDSGSAIPSLSRSDFYSFPVDVPPLPEQRAIAEVLGVLDDKIDANGKLIAAVRQLLAALYEQVASSAGAGWRATTLGEELEVLETGRRPPGGVARYTSGVPSIGAESVIELAAFDYSKTKFVPVEFFEQMKRGVVQDLDVLLYKDGGRPGEFEPHVSLLGDGFPFPRFCINEHVYRIRVRPPLTQEYLYCWLSSGPVLEEMRRRGTGVAIPGLNSSAVRALPMVVPPADVLRSFSQRAAPLVRLALAQARESRTLADMRDALLPPLVSGRLRVSEAGSLVREAV